MAGPGDLHLFAQELLAAAVESLETIPDSEIGLNGAPERSFVSPGQPVFDCCDQLTVHVQAVSEADTTPGGLNAGQRARFGRINWVTMIITSTRCISAISESGAGTVIVPSAADLEADAEQLDADAWALWNHLFNMKAAGQFSTLCSEVFFDGISSIVPSGGCAGWQVTVRASLDGYDESLGS